MSAFNLMDSELSHIMAEKEDELCFSAQDETAGTFRSGDPNRSFVPTDATEYKERHQKLISDSTMSTENSTWIFANNASLPSARTTHTTLSIVQEDLKQTSARLERSNQYLIRWLLWYADLTESFEECGCIEKRKLFQPLQDGLNIYSESKSHLPEKSRQKLSPPKRVRETPSIPEPGSIANTDCRFSRTRETNGEPSLSPSYEEERKISNDSFSTTQSDESEMYRAKWKKYHEKYRSQKNLNRQLEIEVRRLHKHVRELENSQEASRKQHRQMIQKLSDEQAQYHKTYRETISELEAQCEAYSSLLLDDKN